MLKEINIHELIAVDDPVYVIMGDTVYTSEEFFDDEIRILVDEGAAAADQEGEEESEEMIGEECQVGTENDLTAPEEPEAPKKAPQRGKKRGRRSNRDLVEDAMAKGITLIYDIADYTGLRFETVQKIIREIEGEEFNG